MSYVGNKPAQTTIPADDAVTTAMLKDDAVTSAKIDDATIVNADVNASAGIVQSKLATLAITDSEVADNALSGNKIDGGTISNFASTGIDDNADATAITIDSSEQVGIQLATTPAAPLHVKVTGGSGTATEVARFETTGHSDASAVVTDYRTAHTRGEINLLDGTGSYDSNIVFKTATGSLLAAPTEKIRIGPTGEIGIGGATFGTAGDVLTSGGAGAATSWAAAAGGGKVAQVVMGTTTTLTETTSTSYVDSTLTVDITPSATSSKVLVLGMFHLQTQGDDYNTHARWQLLRDATAIVPDQRWSSRAQNSTDTVLEGDLSICYLDSPSTTSATTYKVQIKVASGDSASAQNDSNMSSLIVLEITT